MKALVTGATGFVGSAVARALLRDGWTVRALVRPRSSLQTLEQLPVETAIGDLADRASLQQALAGCDALFHVAADYRLGAREPDPLYASNVRGTANVLDAARTAGVARIVHTSSVATIGVPGDGQPGDEDTPAGLADMIGHYKRSKYLAEQLVIDAARGGAPAVIVNPSTPIGPWDIKPTPTGRMVRDAVRGRMPAYVDTGLNVVHVDDVAAGHLLAWRHGRVGERYILGGEDMTLQAILADIAALAGSRPPRIRLPIAALMPAAYVADAIAGLTGHRSQLTVEGLRMARKRMFFSSAKARRELGYTWRPPREAFADALQWLRARGLA